MVCDAAKARQKPIEFVCPACEDEVVVYDAADGDEIECECGQDLWVEGKSVWYPDVQPSRLSKKQQKALAQARGLQPANKGEAASVAQKALVYLGDVGGDAAQELKVFFLRVRLAVRMVKDAVQGKADVPWQSVAALAGALAYFVLPTDAIPDWLPVIGLVDDATVLALTLKLVNDDVATYARAKHLSLKKYDL